MYKVVQTSRLYQQIVQQIEESIDKGDLKEGDQLPAERDLAQQFGVSRTAVREAVKTLREKGLVEAYAGRGTFITNGSTNSIRNTLDRMIRDGPLEGTVHLAEMREILEPEIAFLAAKRADQETISAMQESISVMDAARNLLHRGRTGARPVSPQADSGSDRTSRSARSPGRDARASAPGARGLQRGVIHDEISGGNNSRHGERT